MKEFEEIYKDVEPDDLEIILKHNRKASYFIRLAKKDKKRTPAELNYLNLVDAWYNSVEEDIKKHLLESTKDMRLKLFIPGWTREEGIERYQRQLVATYVEKYGVAPHEDQIEVTIRNTGLFIHISQPALEV